MDPVGCLPCPISSEAFWHSLGLACGRLADLSDFKTWLRQYGASQQALPAWVCVFPELDVDSVVRGVLRAVDRAGIPAILLCWKEGLIDKGLSPGAFAVQVQNEVEDLQVSVPVFVGLDHGDLARRRNDYDLLETSVCAGLAYVTLDMNDISTDAELDRATTFITGAQSRGVCVELVVGEAGDPLTEPDTAAGLARRTGADLLGVNIGTTHDGPAGDLDFDRADKIARAVPLPLCIHGGSSIPDVSLQAGVRQHFAKVNIGGALRDAALRVSPCRVESEIAAVATTKTQRLLGISC